VMLLILTAAITIFQSIAYFQIYNTGAVWLSSRVDLATPLGAMPVAWFASIDSLFSLLGVAPLILFWAWQARRGREPSDLGKIGLGAAGAAIAFWLLALADLMAGGGKAPLAIPILAWAIAGVAFLYYWPPLLALISRVAPAKVNATMVSGAYLTLFVSNPLMGWFGSIYETMTPAAFWTINGGIAALGAMLVLLFGRRLESALSARLP